MLSGAESMKLCLVPNQARYQATLRPEKLLILDFQYLPNTMRLAESQPLPPPPLPAQMS